MSTIAGINCILSVARSRTLVVHLQANVTCAVRFESSVTCIALPQDGMLSSHASCESDLNGAKWTGYVTRHTDILPISSCNILGLGFAKASTWELELEELPRCV